MKPLKKFIFLIILIALIFLVSLCRFVNKPLHANYVSNKVTTKVKNASPSQTQKEYADLPKIVQPFARTPYLNLADPRWEIYNAKRKIDPTSEWRTPIEFFGKVIDEKNQPVSNVEVEYSWNSTIEKYGGDGVSHKTTQSDMSGLFHIAGIEGQGLTLRVRKKGFYSHVYPNGNFAYAEFWDPRFIEPDRNAPVTFHLVKRPVAEPTFHVDFRSIPKAPEFQTRIDFLAQPAETQTGGDIMINIKRAEHPGYQNPIDWQLSIEGDNGAEVILSEDEFMLRAPDEGYQKNVTKDFNQKRSNSPEVVKFYVRNKSRRFYAAMAVEVTPYYPNHITKEDASCFIVSGTVNPNESPNLEYNAEMDIREMQKK